MYSIYIEVVLHHTSRVQFAKVARFLKLGDSSSFCIKVHCLGMWTEEQERTANRFKCITLKGVQQLSDSFTMEFTANITYLQRSKIKQNKIMETIIFTNKKRLYLTM